MTDRLLSGLEHAGAKFTDFGVIPFTNEITNWEQFPDREVFLHCSTKVLRIFSNEKISPTEIFNGAPEDVAQDLYDRCKRGLYYDMDKFDMSLYMEKLRARLLNGHGEIMTVGDLMEKSFRTPKFVKPGKDLKLFAGDVLDANTKFVEYLDSKTVDASFYDCMDDRVIVSDLVEILAEWRFFVVAGKVVAWSQYRKHGQLKWQRHVPDHVLDAASKMARMYEPAKAFTMDLAMTKDLELKIVEYNCVNCSGHYHADVGALAWALRKV